ncbi:MAG: two-component system regulatory protein YycI [Clostridiales bacterium]|nr:two-component system regulatory protein YycI [Clostridiales bacterium]
MNWKLARNIAIASLALLNVFLAILIFINRPSYSLNAARKNAILSALAKNRLSVNADIPERFKPMPQIPMNPPYYDAYLFIDRFLDGKDISRVIEYDKTIYSDKTGGHLSFFDNEVLFENEAPSDRIEMTISGAKAFCDEILRQNSDVMPNYQLDEYALIKTETGFSVQYRQLYDGYVIYPNRVIFTITENGLSEMSYTYEEPLAPEKVSREIIAPDEALFTLMSRLLNMYRSKAFVIDSIDMIYDKETPGDETARSLNVEPYYRFCVNGLETPFLINAYTGIIK